MIPLVWDGLPEGAESFTFALSQLDGPATFAASSPRLSATLNIHDHPFDQWRVDRFGLAGAQSPIAAPDADALSRWDDVAVPPAGSESWTILRAGAQLTMGGAVWTMLVPPDDVSRQFLRLRAAVI